MRSSAILILFTGLVYHCYAQEQCDECSSGTSSIAGCCCDTRTVEQANEDHFFPVLGKLTNTTYFRYFKVDLYRECPFWGDDDATCASEKCSVCECDPETVPSRLLEAEKCGCAEEGLGGSEKSPYWSVGEGGFSSALQEVKPAKEVGEKISGWELRSDRKQWVVQEEGEGTTYVDLVDNPEGYTGYSGPRAARVWNAIHRENCFEDGEEGTCEEEAVLGRVLSGLQSSITTHIAANADNGAPMPSLWESRVAAFPDRLSNLYVSFLFVARALNRVSPALKRLSFATGTTEADERSTRKLLRELSKETSDHVSQVFRGFDESNLFTVKAEDIVSSCPPVVNGLEDLAEMQTRARDAIAKKTLLREKFRRTFRNVSRIMDCVDCHRCRLWGKVQFTGIGTAMRILFDPDTQIAENEDGHLVDGKGRDLIVEELLDGGIALYRGEKLVLEMSHNEVVSLIWVFFRLSESIDQSVAFRTLRKQTSSELPEAVPASGDPILYGVLALAALGGIASFVILFVSVQTKDDDRSGCGPIAIQTPSTTDQTTEKEKSPPSSSKRPVRRRVKREM